MHILFIYDQVVAGYLVDTGSTGSNIDYSPAFLVMACLMIVDIACAALIKIPPVERPTSVWAGVLSIVRQPRVAVFYAACLIEGLQQCFDLKIMHRDFKPENILIDDNKHIKIVSQHILLVNSNEPLCPLLD